VNNRVKKYAIYGYLLVLTKDLLNANVSQKDAQKKHGEQTTGTEDVTYAVRSNALDINRKIYKAVDLIPAYYKLSPKEIRKVDEHIRHAFQQFGIIHKGMKENHSVHTEKRLEVLLAFSLAGLEDIRTHAEGEYLNAVNDLIDAVMHLSEIIDPNGTQVKEYIKGEFRYENWIKR